MKLLLWGCITLLLGCQPSNTVELSVKAITDGRDLVFEVLNDTLSNVTLRVNGDYEYKMAKAVPGELYTFSLSEFATRGGERYVPYEIKPKRLWVSADLSGGRKGTTLVGW